MHDIADDIVLLLDPEGAGRMGHTAVLVEDHKKGGWWYISKSGVKGGGIDGVDYEYFKTIAEFHENHPRYDKMIRFSTNKSQDYKAMAAIIIEGIKRYHFINSNCWHATRAGLKAAGIALPWKGPYPNLQVQKVWKLHKSN